MLVLYFWLFAVPCKQTTNKNCVHAVQLKNRDDVTCLSSFKSEIVLYCIFTPGLVHNNQNKNRDGDVQPRDSGEKRRKENETKKNKRHPNLPQAVEAPPRPGKVEEQVSVWRGDRGKQKHAAGERSA